MASRPVSVGWRSAGPLVEVGAEVDVGTEDAEDTKSRVSASRYASVQPMARDRQTS